ncbi:hypothetical protein ACIP5Y_00160 [Nocardia sp. NPDC088792]|uniref:hypothetical protein n=1 Tax=Nocardia sp. NPDC088792 TaxID=3364332 RepID=UPI0037F901CC
MEGYRNPQGSTVVVYREGSILHVTVSRAIDEPPLSQASWSAQLAAAAKRELGRPAQRLTCGLTAVRDSSGARRQRRSAAYLIDSAFTIADRGDELHITLDGPLTADGAATLSAQLPFDYALRRHCGEWWLTRGDQFLHKLQVGAKVVVALPPRCELAEHFATAVLATTRTTVRGSMPPFLTVAYACAAHTPTLEQILAHNHALGETVDSIETTDLSSGHTLASWTPDSVTATP